MHMLDTDMCIYLLGNRQPGAAARLRAAESGTVATGAITVAELRYGAMRSSWREANLELLEAFLQPFEILDFDTRAANYFGAIKYALATQGQLTGPMDMLIAATALANDAILVTNNIREFSRVPDLRVENWAEPAT